MSDTSNAPEGGGGIGGVLNRKVGGVPVKWLILVGVLALAAGIAYRQYKARNGTVSAPTSQAAPASASVDTTTDGGEAYSTAGGSNLSSGGGFFTQNAGSSTFAGTQTNAAWATAVANGLSSQGYTPLDVQNALSAYLAGTALTGQQTAIINAAIAGWGSPPEGVIASTTTTVTPSKFTFLYVQDNNGGLWSLINTTNGSVQQTRSQAEANAWSAQYGINATPTSISTLQGAIVVAQGGH